MGRLIVKQNPDKLNEWVFVEHCCEELRNSRFAGWNPEKMKISWYKNPEDDERYFDECPICHTKLEIILQKNFMYHTEKPIEFEEPKELTDEEIKKAEKRRKEMNRAEKRFYKAYEESKKRGSLF